MGYSTGNRISDDIGKLNFTGNVIPSVWFQTVTGINGKPNLLACQLLSEIVYWYRPTEIRDEQTGCFAGYRTKFRGDLLQKSYKSLAELYHVSKQQVIRAIVFLEKEIHVVKRVFRSVPGRDGTVYNNVLFIWLDTERLKELTYPFESDREGHLPDIDDELLQEEAQEDVDNVDNVDSDTPLPSNLMGPSHQKRRDPPIKFDGTNTEITTKINYNSNSFLSCPNESGKDRDGPDGRKEKTAEYDDIIRDQIAYDLLRNEFVDRQEMQAVDVLDTCVSIAASVYRHTGRYLQISGERMPIGVAQNLLKKLNMFHARHIVRAYLDVDQDIKNVRAYMLACIFNTIRTLPAQEANLFVSRGMGIE